MEILHLIKRNYLSDKKIRLINSQALELISLRLIMFFVLMRQIRAKIYAQNDQAFKSQ